MFRDEYARFVTRGDLTLTFRLRLPTFTRLPMLLMLVPVPTLPATMFAVGRLTMFVVRLLTIPAVGRDQLRLTTVGCHPPMRVVLRFVIRLRFVVRSPRRKLLTVLPIAGRFHVVVRVVGLHRLTVEKLLRLTVE